MNTTGAHLHEPHHLHLSAVLLGQRIFQLPQVDFGERPDRFGLEVHYWWRSLWTGQFVWTVFSPVQMIMSLDVIIWFYLQMHLICPFRLISMNWSRVAQRSSSPMTTRRNTSSKYSSWSDIKTTAKDLLLTVLLFASLVMQWRFVNRVLKQMTAFKEVRTSSRSVFLHLM